MVQESIDVDKKVTSKAKEPQSESKDQADLKRIRQKQAEASRRYRLKKRSKPSPTATNLTASTQDSSPLIVEVTQVKQKLAEMEARQYELLQQNHEANMKLQKAEETISLAAEIIKRMKAELADRDCKESLGVRRKAKTLKKNATN